VGGIFVGHNLLLSRAFFGGNPSMYGIFLGRNLLLPRAFFGGNPSMGGIFLGHNLLLSQASFSWTEFWLSQSLSQKLFSFFTMDFRLSRSPSLSFFFHDGISAITKPFSFFLFSRWNFGYHGALLFLSFFTMEFRLSRSPSHELFLFSRWNCRDTKYETCNLGEDSFHIYIRKSIYTGSASLKTLPLDLEPPLQGKEYGPSYSSTTIKK
jgi:hypothetical protein